MNQNQIPDLNRTETNSPTPEPSNSRAVATQGIVYVLENPAMPGYIKLGKTDNLNRRMRELFDTPVPVPFTCYYAARIEDPAKVEKSLFEA